MTKFKIGIEGMACMHCVNRVEKALLSVQGVTAAEVSLENKSAIVTGGDEQSLKAAVTEAGYSVTEMTAL